MKSIGGVSKDSVSVKKNNKDINMTNELWEGKIGKEITFSEAISCNNFEKRNVNTTTPSRMNKKRPGSVMSSIKKKGGKLMKTLTPPRHLNVGLKTPVRNKAPGDVKLTLSSRFEGNYDLRSSEIDPSPFQIEIPTHKSILESCKLCALMDNYTELGGVDFDFKMLMPYMQADLTSVIFENSTDTQFNANNRNSHPVSIALQEAVQDIVVQAFFREYFAESNSDNGIGRVEVCVLSSDQNNKIYVVYRSSTYLQDKPIQGIQKKLCDLQTSKREDKENGSNNDMILSKGISDDALNDDINISFLGAFNLLKEPVFNLLERLTVLNPFSDVTFLGHSFGGGLATVAACKYAKLNQGTRVYSHVFGSPKVGGRMFRNEVHSLSNLNVLRMERHTDPFTSMPEDNSKWIHVGHCLSSGPSVFSSLITSDETRPIEFQLYRFDKHRVSSKFSKSWNNFSNLTKLKIGNEIKSYQKDIEKVTNLNLKWVDTFVGESPVEDQNAVSFEGVFA